jgi:hypothetical protein
VFYPVVAIPLVALAKAALRLVAFRMFPLILVLRFQSGYSDPARWNPEGETFPSYGIFRDELVSAMRNGQKRLAIVSPVVTDGDIATVLFAAQIKGLQTLALVDSRSARIYNSRHEFLAKANVPTWLVHLSKYRMDSLSLFAIDNSVWSVNVKFSDESKGQVKISAASVTADEVFAWQGLREPGLQKFRSMQPSASGTQQGAKKSTTGDRLARSDSANISEVDEGKQSGGRIPRRLPRQTRLQGLVGGKLTQEGRQESTGSLKVPAPPANESDVAEETDGN